MPSPDTCIVSGTLYDASGDVKANARFTLWKVIKGGVLVSSISVDYKTNASGQLVDHDGETLGIPILRGSVAFIDAPAVGLNSKPGTGVALTIPDAATANLEDLIPATSTTLPGASQAALQAHAATIASADTLGHVKVGDGLSIDGDGVLSADGGGGGVTDHGALTGLADDDHPQYHNNARGDARYPLLTDPRLTDARVPTGGAGGVLSGSFPDPGFAVNMATQAELDSHAASIGTHDDVTLTSPAEGDFLWFDGADWVNSPLEAADIPTLTSAKISDFNSAASAAAPVQTADLTANAAADRARANHIGTQSADTLTDGTTNKAFLATERTKLAGVATGATANGPDATLLARANHTGTQLAATISDFNTAVDARINYPVTLAGAETLTNKTLTAPVINSPTGLVKADVGLGSVLNVAQEPAIAAGLNSQYWRGDKTWQTLNAAAVSGLGSLATVTPTGTPDGTKFLRDDGAWQAVAGLGIGNAISGGTQGSVLFAGSGGGLAQDNSNFFFDDTNNRLGLGLNASLAGKVHVQCGAADERGMVVQAADSQTANLHEWRNSAGTVLIAVAPTGSAGNGLGAIKLGASNDIESNSVYGQALLNGNWIVRGEFAVANFGSVNVQTGVLKVANVQVVGAQGAAVADADGTLADITTKFNALLSRLRASTGHGLIA